MDQKEFDKKLDALLEICSKCRTKEVEEQNNEDIDALFEQYEKEYEQENA